MASNPPFEVEDQTDEDFFDKLVNDDDDGGGGSLKVPELKADDKFIVGDDDSDEAKALTNLSLNESEKNDDDSEVKGATINDAGILGLSHQQKEQPVEEVGCSLATSDLFSFDNGHVSNEDAMESEVKSDLTRRESVESAGGAVKEVQWSSFTDSAAHESNGFGSYMDFFSELGDGAIANESNTRSDGEVRGKSDPKNLYDYVGNHGENGVPVAQSASGLDSNSIEYWESLYPGWKYDPNSGQWYQVDGGAALKDVQEKFGASMGNVQGNVDGNVPWAVSDGQSSHISHSQQTTHSMVETVSHSSKTENAYSWNQSLQGSGGYPEHMIFDPQYPGWYYDTMAQEWRSLEAYHASSYSADQFLYQQAQNGFSSTETYSHINDQSINNSAISQGISSGNQNQSWGASFSAYPQQGIDTWQSGASLNTSHAGSGVRQPWEKSHESSNYPNNYVDQQSSFDYERTFSSYNQGSPGYDNSNMVTGSHGFVSGGNHGLQFNMPSQIQENGQLQYPSGFYGGQQNAPASQQLLPNGHHVPYVDSGGRSSAGRPPHALVTFGFGGKLIVMKDNSSVGYSSLGSKDIEGHSISVLNMMDVAAEKSGASGTGQGVSSYLDALCHRSFPGPLVGGNAGTKELNKWIDERIANCESLGMDYGKAEAMKLLLSLLKIACQHYGKLRSLGTDGTLMENDLPELAVAKLFASAKSGGHFGQYGVSTCLANLPSEAEIKTTAFEVQNLLVSGRKREALQRAQGGQFWALALVLARELGDQFYFDTVKQMAQSQLLVGTPLRTLCLLIAKKPEDVFSANTLVQSSRPRAPHMSSQPAQVMGYSMLDNWEENLAVITANRTENDHLVITHLGDCLLKERNDITAAHICYLVAEADFESYSDSARLCLIGADHWNYPRSYASPEAIQRTELFEYSKVLGNSQFVLLPFQPYKLVYAHMLAEVGKVSESLRYCQALHKSLKTGRSPEVDALKQLLSSLEERIRTHQQGGYAANLAPAKIVGKLLNLFDSTAHRVVGGLPPPGPSAIQSGAQGGDPHYQMPGSKVSSSQSTMGASSLMPSASMEPISQWAVDSSRMTMHNRSVSEPDIGRTPRQGQVDSSNEATSSNAEGKQSVSTGSSRFGRFNFGAQILQKTVGLVLKPRQGRQAKLGEANRFYYDEKLKRWVEEGAELPPEETAPPPPPPTAAFQNGPPDYNLKNAFNNEMLAEESSPEFGSSYSLGNGPGIPAIPPSSNQFSARGRTGVRSRYVDTFNKGGGNTTNLFKSPSVPAIKPATAGSAKFFIPTPTSSVQSPPDPPTGVADGGSESEENSSSTTSTDPFQNLTPPLSATMPRFPSVDNISNNKMLETQNTSLSSLSRRTASWSGTHVNSFTPQRTTDEKGMSPLSFTSIDSSPVNVHASSDSLGVGEELQEVEL